MEPGVTSDGQCVEQRLVAVLDDTRCYAGSYRVRASVDAGSVEKTFDRAGTATWSLAATQTGTTNTSKVFTGHPIVLSGKLSPASDAPVTIWEKVGTTNKVVARFRAGLDGSYSRTIYASAGSHRWFVNSSADPTLAGSAVRTVQVVRPTITAKALGTIDSLKSVNVIGRLESWGYPRKVELYVAVNGRWSRHYVGRTRADGSYSLPFTFKPGTLASYTMMTQAYLPNGSAVHSANVTVTRTLVLNARVRATTAADVAKTYRSGCPVGPSQLRTVEMNYLGYDKLVHRGVLIVRSDLTPEVISAFTRGTVSGRFPIQRMSNPNVWAGDDVAMMAAGNTSAFNCRRVTGNPYRMSPHSYGKAIDVNTIENPYLVNGRWYPSATYGSYRPASVKGLLTSSSALTVGLKGQGYSWYSGWDWQHFQK